MPSTWREWSIKYVGYEMPLTEGNARYLAVLRTQDVFSQGYSPEEAALLWNRGSLSHKVGVNSYGVKYDTYAYVNKFKKYYR